MIQASKIQWFNQRGEKYDKSDMRRYKIGADRAEVNGKNQLKWSEGK